MKYSFLLGIAALIACSSWVYGDVIILSDGSTIEGTIIEEDWKSLLVKTPREKKRVEKKDIQLIRKPNETIVPRTSIPSLQPSKPVTLSDPPTSLFRFNDESVIKVSFDTEGTHTVSSKLSIDGVDSSSTTVSSVDQGWEVSAEYTFYSRYAGIGGGAALQLPRATTFNDGNFYFAPLYLLVKLRTPPTAHNFFVYAAGHGGYNFIIGDNHYKGEGGSLSGGAYYGYGFGAAIGALRCEILRTVNKGLLESSGYLYTNYIFTLFTHTSDIEYTKTSLSIIYSF